MDDTVKSLPVPLGKHRIGTISATKALAMQPIGMLRRPRFQGPGRNLFPTKKTRMKIGVVKATNAAQAPIEKMAPIASSPIRTLGPRQVLRGGNAHTAKDKQQQDVADEVVEPHCIDRSAGKGVHMLPVLRERKAIISGIGKCDPRRCDHAALTHREAGDDRQREHGEDRLFREHLDQVCREGLAQATLKSARNVNDRIGNH